MHRTDGSWKRAIVYMAWGRDYIEQACQNAVSVAGMQIPIILVTDKNNQHLVPDEHPFTSIKIIDKFRSYDMLAKSTIYDIAPEEYDSLLYLDTDTVVLEDISFGFEMAEKHGIAISPATAYCLPSHHDFRRIMVDAGLPDAGQLQYNAGIHFFVRRPDVQQVYDLYQKSAYDLTEQYAYANRAGKLADQPFLSYAMEVLGFNPYTLSINYCYRGIDAEVACGDIRIWHSHHDVPVGINDYHPYDGPRRRYYAGRAVDMKPVYAQLTRSRKMRNLLQRLKKALPRVKKPKGAPPDSQRELADVKGAHNLADLSRLRMQDKEQHLGGYIMDGAAPGTWCPQVWDWIYDELGVRSVLDVGSGLGHAAKYFRDLGARVSAVEGSPSAVRNSVVAEDVVQHDYTHAPYVPPSPFDLVWSAEFVEHVEEKYSGNFLMTFSAAQKFVFLTYAEPGQGGHHHVNEQPMEYWITRMELLGFNFDRKLTEKSRNLIGDHKLIGKHFRSRGLVFVRKDLILES